MEKDKEKEEMKEKLKDDGGSGLRGLLRKIKSKKSVLTLKGG